MKKLLGVVMLTAVLSGSGLAPNMWASDLRSLVRAERAFAELSAAQGIRPAFLANLAEEAIVFRPVPVPGRKAYEDRLEIPGHLTWRPVFADISAGGDLGYTTGPYEFRDKELDKVPSSCGHYVSLWRVGPDGTWKVIIDVGIKHSCEGEQEPDFTAGTAERVTFSAPRVDVKKEQAVLLARDRELATWTAKNDSYGILLEAMADDIRLYRSGHWPVKGKRSARSLIFEKKGVMNWRPMAAGLSAGGDLGYTYGTSEIVFAGPVASPKETSSYLRIWKKINRAWRIVLDLANLVPPEGM
jgi:ketosteroid isomerase-like protein